MFVCPSWYNYDKTFRFASNCIFRTKYNKELSRLVMKKTFCITLGLAITFVSFVDTRQVRAGTSAIPNCGLVKSRGVQTTRDEIEGVPLYYIKGEPRKKYFAKKASEYRWRANKYKFKSFRSLQEIALLDNSVVCSTRCPNKEIIVHHTGYKPYDFTFKGHTDGNKAVVAYCKGEPGVLAFDPSNQCEISNETFWRQGGSWGGRHSWAVRGLIDVYCLRPEKKIVPDPNIKIPVVKIRDPRQDEGPGVNAPGFDDDLPHINACGVRDRVSAKAIDEAEMDYNFRSIYNAALATPHLKKKLKTKLRQKLGQIANLPDTWSKCKYSKCPSFLNWWGKEVFTFHPASEKWNKTYKKTEYRISGTLAREFVWGCFPENLKLKSGY